MTNEEFDWGDLLKEVKKEGGGGITEGPYYLKNGEQKIRVVLPAEVTDPRKFFARYENVYEGEAYPYYLIEGVVLTSEGGGADPKRVQCIKITKTVLVQLIQALAQGWELFDPVAGKVVSIVRGKQKGRVAYTCTITPKSVDVSAATRPDYTLEEAAQNESDSTKRWDAEKRAGGGKGKADENDDDLPF